MYSSNIKHWVPPLTLTYAISDAYGNDHKGLYGSVTIQLVRICIEGLGPVAYAGAQGTSAPRSEKLRNFERFFGRLCAKNEEKMRND